MPLPLRSGLWSKRVGRARLPDDTLVVLAVTLLYTCRDMVKRCPLGVKAPGGAVTAAPGPASEANMWRRSRALAAGG